MLAESECALEFMWRKNGGTSLQKDTELNAYDDKYMNNIWWYDTVIYCNII